MYQSRPLVTATPISTAITPPHNHFVCELPSGIPGVSHGHQRDQPLEQRSEPHLTVPSAAGELGRVSEQAQGASIDADSTAQAPSETRADGAVAIVVLTYDRAHLLRQCVENLLARTSERVTEIVVWNNASTDGTREYLDSLGDPRFRVVHHERNIGQNAYDEAFALTSAPYLIELDDDMIDAPAEWACAAPGRLPAAAAGRFPLREPRRQSP